jgi:hypothetical protein
MHGLLLRVSRVNSGVRASKVGLQPAERFGFRESLPAEKENPEQEANAARNSEHIQKQGWENPAFDIREGWQGFRLQEGEFLHHEET